MWIKLSQIILRNRILILTILLGFTVLFGYNAINNVKMDNKYGTMLPRDSPAKQNYIKLKSLFSENESLLVFAIDNKDLYTLEKFNAWYELGKAIRSFEAVDSVFSEAHIYQLSKNTAEKKFELDKIINHKPESQAELDSLKSVIKSNPFYDGLIYNDSTESSLMMVFVDEAIMDDMKKAVVLLDVEAKAKEFETLLGPIRISGMPHIRVSVGEKLKAELGLFIALTIIVTSLLLFIFFRSLKIVLICNIVVFVGVIWSLGSIGFFDFKLSILMVLIPPLMIVISIPNSIFLINKFHQEIKDHGNKVKALTLVIQKIGNATFLTNLTTAMGFATFIFTNSERLFEFGIIAALNIIMVFVLSITILPIILSYSAIPKPKHLQHLEKQWLHIAVEKLEYVTLYRRKQVFIGAGIVILIAIIGAINIKATGNITGDLPQDDPITNDVQYLQDKFGGAIPFEILIDTKKKNAYLYRFEELEQIQDKLVEYNVFSKSLSVADGVKLINMAYSGGNPDKYNIPSISKMNRFKPYLENATTDAGVNPFIDSSNIYTHITLQIQDLGSYEVQELIDSLGPELRSILNPKQDEYEVSYQNIISLKGEEKNNALSELYFDRPEIYQNLITVLSGEDSDLKDEFMMDENKIYSFHDKKSFDENLKTAFDIENWDLVFTGTAVVASNGTQYLVNNLFTSLAIAIVLIAILMSILFRSWRMVIISLIPNFIPLLTTAGIMGIFGIPIKPSTLLVFSIAFGISVDDTIHFLAKFRQELKNHEHDLRRCILVALRETGISMIYTSIVLFFGFLVLAFSQFGGTKALGILVSLTLLIAMLANLLILPSLLLFMQRKMSNKAIREPLFELFDEETDIELNHLEIEESLQKYQEEDLKTVKMIDLLPYQQSIEKGLSNIQFSKNPANLYDPLRYFLKIGGKRMRPILALMACELYGNDTNKALDAAIAVELFHNFSLIHDDIMDEAPLRRGQETVHVKWNQNVAILSGDVLLVKSYQSISNYDSDIALELLKVFNKTAVEVCEGQQWDMDFETAENVKIEDYLQMIKYKTAVLLGCSLEMGAIVSSATKEDRQALYDFGVNLGLAFQLQDDLLDVFADQSKFGKQVGGDILANKKTFLLLTAFNDANQAQSKQLIELQSEKDNSIKIKETKQLYTELSVKQKTQNKIEYYYNVAMESFAKITVSGSQKKPLLILSEFLMNREH